MKKIIFFISLIFLFASTTKAQTNDWRGGYEELLDEQEGVTANGKFWKTSDTKNYNLVQVSYVADSGGNGLSLSYKRGINLTKGKLPLYIEPGIELQYNSVPYYYDWRWDEYENESCGTLTIPVNFSYKFKFNQFSVAPITGPQFSYDSERECVFGWNIGARLAYGKVSFDYHYTAALVGRSDGVHQVGIGILF